MILTQLYKGERCISGRIYLDGVSSTNFGKHCHGQNSNRTISLKVVLASTGVSPQTTSISLSFVHTSSKVSLVIGASTPPFKWVLKKYCKCKKIQVEESHIVRICDDIGDKYRYGFNGQEKVNEIAGIGNHNTALFWEYDTRTGRRWNLDPVDQVSISNYAVNMNSPIRFNDENGDIPTAVVGFIVGMGVDVISQAIMINMGLQEEFSWSSVFISGATGAIGVGIGAKIAVIGGKAGSAVINKVVSSATDIAANTALGVAEDAVKDYAEDGSLDETPDIKSNVIGAVAGKAAGNIAENIYESATKKSTDATLKNAEKQLERVERKAINNPKKSPNTTRNKDVRNAKENVENIKAKNAKKITKAGIVAGAPSSNSAKEVNKKSSNQSLTACFIGGTMVATKSGFKKIEDINEGDTLYTRNEASGILEYDIVYKAVKSFTDKLCVLKISDGSEIYVTQSHSFFINKGYWQQAQNLKVGDSLWSSNNHNLSIQSISFIIRNVDVYNLVMNKNHNYFIDFNKILVHNAEIDNEPHTPTSINPPSNSKYISR